MNSLTSCLRFAAFGFVGFVMIFPSIAGAVPLVFSVGGNNTPASIQTTVDNFRSALGDPNNGNNPGPLNSGRREINWDGGGQATTVSPTPFNAFQNIRGPLFTTAGTGFVQAPLSGLATTFNNATYATIFSTFSDPRLFSPIGSNITDATFSIPGTNGLVPGTVSAFGAVFTDVDLANTTSIQYFDLTGASLGTFFVPAGVVPSGSLSFLGVSFTTERIGRVRITNGNAAPGPNDGGAIDVVLLDDLIFAEPRAIPEASAVLLLGLGFFGLSTAVFCRRDSNRP